MKFMEKAKRFFTLSAKREGFTLVELIVVIAILAILAGVAVPAYSGYINKSKRASDDTLLNAVNKAFASSLSANGSDIWLTSDATLAETANSYTIATVNGKADAKVAASFALFFQGNEGLKFEVIKPVFDPYQAMFVAAGEETKWGTKWGDKDVDISMKSKDAFMNSIHAEDIDGLQNTVHTLSGAFGNIAGGSNATLLENWFGSDYVDMLEENGYTDGTSMGNAAVLYIADKTAGMTAQDVANNFHAMAGALENGDDLMTVLNTGDPLVNAATMYGAISAYAAQSKDTTLQNQVAGVTDADSLMELFQTAASDKKFVSYVGTFDGEGNTTVTDSFATDMNGFLGALDAVNTVSPNMSKDEIGSSNLWVSDNVENILNSLTTNS